MGDKPATQSLVEALMSNLVLELIKRAPTRPGPMFPVKIEIRPNFTLTIEVGKKEGYSVQ